MASFSALVTDMDIALALRFIFKPPIAVTVEFAVAWVWIVVVWLERHLADVMYMAFIHVIVATAADQDRIPVAAFPKSINPFSYLGLVANPASKFFHRFTPHLMIQFQSKGSYTGQGNHNDRQNRGESLGSLHPLQMIEIL
jgi:hypothetical protein